MIFVNTTIGFSDFFSSLIVLVEKYHQNRNSWILTCVEVPHDLEKVPLTPVFFHIKNQISY